MIKSFKHKGLEKFFTENSKKGIQAEHAKKLTSILTSLNIALVIENMDLPGWNLHLLHPTQYGFWSVKVNGNWRVVFRWEDRNADDVDYLDYHGQ